MLLAPEPPGQRCGAIEKRECIRGDLTAQTELPSHELVVKQIRILPQYDACSLICWRYVERFCQAY
jgi:hypothetical protein